MEFRVLELGGGVVKQSEGEEFQLSIPGGNRGYTDAQIDDTARLPRVNFPWTPPASFKVRARVLPGSPVGTFGFGFWNDPFTLSLGMQGSVRRLPVAPQALWFFYGSPPNDIQLRSGGSGAGWKAMSLRSPQLPGWVTMFLALLGIGFTQLPLTRGWIMRTAQRVVHVDEALLRAREEEWHNYQIVWGVGGAKFVVDGAEVLSVDRPPVGPLGFVAWIDNQYAIASPKGGFRFGVIPTSQSQTLELRELILERS